MKILVTGGAGFIGSHLVDRLLELGHEVYVLDDLSTGKLINVHPKAHFMKHDVASGMLALSNFKGEIDVIYHLAARARVIPSFNDPLEYHKNNVLGTAHMLEMARCADVKRFIFASSSSVYGSYGKKDMPFSEKLPAAPQSPYAWDKIVGETLCMEYAVCYKLSTVALRFFNVYGSRMASGQYSTVIQAFLDAKRAGKPLPIRGDGEHTRDYTHVSDVVDALIKAIEADLPNMFRVFNIGGGENHSVNEVAELIVGPVKHGPAVDEPSDTLADIALAKKWLGWEPKTKFKDGIMAMVLAEKIKANG